MTEPNHQVTLDTSLVFGLVIAFLAGVLGAAVALIYHLSHLDSLHHTVQHYSEQRAAQRSAAIERPLISSGARAVICAV